LLGCFSGWAEVVTEPATGDSPPSSPSWEMLRLFSTTTEPSELFVRVVNCDDGADALGRRGR
jgi:hypothetical protein